MKKIGALVILALPLVGCGPMLGHLIGSGPTLKGSGKLKTEVRSLASFHQVEIGGASDAVVIRGPKPSVKITADDNLMSQIRTQVINGKLVVDHLGSFSTQHGITLVITVPSIDGIQITGGGKAQLVGLHANSFDAQLSGAAELRADGNVNTFHLTASGASKAELGDVPAKSATVEASGASKIQLWVSGSISGSLSGASRLEYHGNGQAHVTTSGAASVHKS